jgi:hypothetical protein
MTTPDERDDELVDAVLDGTADQDALALVAADPALTARLERLRTVRVALGPAPTDGAGAGAEERIAAALAATVVDPPSPGADPARVTVIAPGRGRGRRLTLIGAAAAVVVVVLGAVFVVRSIGDDRTTSLADGPSSAPTSTSAPGDASAAAPEAAPTTTVPAAAGATRSTADLGDYASVAALDAALEGNTRFDATAQAGADGLRPAGDCTGELAAAGAQPLGRARVAGEPVAVGRGPSGPVVLSVDGCQPIG